MGKVKIGIYFCVTADILTKFYRNVPGVVLYQPYEFCQNHWFWLGAMATERLNFFFSEAIRGMKLKLCINVHDISLYINDIFYCLCHVLLFLWQLSLHIHVLIMGKWKLEFISVLLQIFWQKFYWNVSGVVLYQWFEFCPNRWFWLVAMASKRLNFQEKKKLKNLLRSHRGMKLKLCIHVHDISLYINSVLYCCCPCAFIAIAT